MRKEDLTIGDIIFRFAIVGIAFLIVAFIDYLGY